MLAKWPWRVGLIMLACAVMLYCSSLAGTVHAVRIPAFAEHLMVALCIAVFAYEFVVDVQWKRTWTVSHGPSSPDPMATSQRSRLFYTLGLVQLYVVILGLASAIWWSLFSLECFITLVFAMAVAHGLFKSGRRLASLPDEIQTDATKMAALGLEPMAMEKDMTRAGVIAICFGVLLTVFLCLKLLYEIAHNHP